MSESRICDAGLASVRSDLAALRDECLGVTDHLKSGAGDNAQSVAGPVRDGVSEFSRSAARERQNASHARGARMENRPLLTFLIAVGVGHLGASPLRR